MTAPARIPTNLRTLRIIEVLGLSETAMTPTEINAHIGLPKQTIHRLCSTLEEEGFLAREPDGKRLRPSRRLRMMGAGILHNSQLHISRHQVLKVIAAQLKETVNFVVPEDAGMQYIDRVETDWPFRIQLPVGSNVPFHCTASGKIYMASMSKSARKTFVAGLELGRLTSKTLTDRDALLADLQVCAKRGYSIDNEEFMDGMIALAVPVKDGAGRYVASIAYHGPVQRLSVEQLIERKQIMLDGAQKLQEAVFS